MPGSRRPLALAAGLLLAVGPLLPVASAPTAGQTPPATVAGLRGEARAILREVEAHTLPLAAARVRVERLLRALRGLGAAEGWSPTARRLELTISRPEDLDLRIEEECPLFYEEELVELCPLDAGRSEIWGNQVLVCAFACVPAEREPGRE